MTQPDGQQIFQALLGVRQLHRHASMLLRAASEAMSGAGFSVLGKDGYALTNLSYKLDKPKQWMPDVVFRFFAHPTRRQHALFVSVVLCPRSPEKLPVPFVEPLVSAGWVKMAKEIKGWGSDDYWWAKMITWAKGDRDGSPIRWMDEGKAWLEECCLAMPLVAVQDETTLVHRILSPLVQSLELPLPADWAAPGEASRAGPSSSPPER